jgi:hypothetical protein
LDKRQAYCVLAALPFWQQKRRLLSDDDGCLKLEKQGGVAPLSDDEIDELCLGSVPSSHLEEPMWLFTVVPKGEYNEDTAPAALVYDGDLIQTIKLMLGSEDTAATHVEIHEGELDDQPYMNKRG